MADDQTTTAPAEAPDEYHMPANVIEVFVDDYDMWVEFHDEEPTTPALPFTLPDGQVQWMSAPVQPWPTNKPRA